MRVEEAAVEARRRWRGRERLEEAVRAGEGERSGSRRGERLQLDVRRAWGRERTYTHVSMRARQGSRWRAIDQCGGSHKWCRWESHAHHGLKVQPRLRS